MGKEQILAELNRSERQLSSYERKLKDLEEQYAVLEEFSAKCHTRISSFDSSMIRRKRRLFDIDNIISSVKSAARYKSKMNEMLTGTEYAVAVSAIDNLQNSIANRRKKLREDIGYVEDQIESLELRVEELQHEYDTYPEEETINVEGK